MSGTPQPDRIVDVLIVGGGNGGIAAAARFLRRGVADVAVVEPQRVHTYRPLLSYVGGGEATVDDAERTQRSVTPRDCRWITSPAVAVDPVARTVRCADGTVFGYRDLVLAVGLVPDDGALPGVENALATPAVGSNYLDRAEQTWTAVQALPAGGRAVFTVPRPPVSCTGTTLKPVFLAAAHWRRERRDVHVSLVVDRAGFLDVPAIDDRLRHHLDDANVHVLHRTAVTALHPDERAITVRDDGGVDTRMEYDMLHLVPPFRGPAWLEASDLTAPGSHGLVDVDPHTLRHRTYERIWAIGDCATLDTDPSGGALRKQTAVLVDNVLAARRGAELTAYSGYTVAPIATDAHRLMFGEFERGGLLASSLPSFVDPLKSRRSTWAFDRYGLPPMYWHLILKGLA